MSALTGNLGGGGIGIKNGVLRSDLVAIENIEKNMFVDILENLVVETNTTTYPHIEKGVIYDSCRVSEDKGIFIHARSGSDSTIYGTVFSVNDDGTVTFGNETMINTGEYWHVRPRCFYLKDNKVLLVNNGTTNDPGNLCLITVDGLNFTVGSNKKNAVFFNYGCFDFEEVSHNNFVLTGEIETNRVVGGQVIAYDESNDSLSFGKTYALDGISNSGDNGDKQRRIAKESENKFLYIAGTQVAYLYRMKVNTIDKTISRENSIELLYDNVYKNYPKSFVLFENDIYIANHGNAKVNLSYGVLGDEPIKLETVETNVKSEIYGTIQMVQVDYLSGVAIAFNDKREVYLKTKAIDYEEKYKFAYLQSISVIDGKIVFLGRPSNLSIVFVVANCYEKNIRKRAQSDINLKTGISVEKISEGSIGKVLV